MGYRYVNLDAGWKSGRNKTGFPIPDSKKFSSGMPSLVDYVHAKGLKFGIYRDRHHDFGFEKQDAKQFAEWGVDYVKNDGYGAHDNVSSSEIYARFDAVNSTGRPMLLNIKFDTEPGGFSSADELANSWRVGRDIRPVWADVVRLADISSAIAHLAHPGGFNDLMHLKLACQDKVDAMAAIMKQP